MQESQRVELSEPVATAVAPVLTASQVTPSKPESEPEKGSEASVLGDLYSDTQTDTVAPPYLPPQRRGVKTTTSVQGSSVPPPPPPGQGRGRAARRRGGVKSAPRQAQGTAVPAPGLTPTPPVVTNPKPASKGSVTRTFAANMRHFKVSMLDSQKNAKSRLKQLGVPFMESDAPDDGYHPHPAAAAVRRYATAQALTSLYEKGARRVLSYRGSERDLSILRYLNDAVPLRDQMELMIYRPVDLPDDIPRERAGLDVTFSAVQRQGYDGVFLCDVYGLHDGLPLNPRNLCMLFGDVPIVWIGHLFEGAWGTIENEGAWVRSYLDGREFIEAQVETLKYTRTPHDPCDWLSVPGVERVDGGSFLWSLSRAVGDTVEIHMRRVAGQVPIPIVGPRQAAYEWVDLPIPEEMESTCARFMLWLVLPLGETLRKPLLSILTRRRALVDLRVKLALRHSFAGRSMTSYSWRAMCAAANAVLQTQGCYEVVAQRFPGRMEAIAESTAMAAFLEGLAGRAQAMGWLNVFHGGDMERYNASVASVGESVPATSYWKRLAIALLLGGGFWLYCWYRLKIRPRMENTSLACLPIGETLARWSAGGVKALTMGWSTVNTWATSRVKTASSTSASWLVSAMKWAGLSVYRDRHSVARNLGGALAATALLVPDMCFEEVVKGVPYLRVAFPLIELGAKAVTGQLVSPGHLGGAILAMGMHYISLPLSYFQRLCIHVGWNFGVLFIGFSTTSTGHLDPWSYGVLAVLGFILLFRWARAKRRLTPFEGFCEQYYETPWEARGPIPNDGVTALTSFPATRSRVAHEGRPYVSNPKELDALMKVKGTPYFDVEEEVQGFTTFIMPTNVPMYVPAKTNSNLWAVAQNRLLVDPPLDPEEQFDNWEPLFHVVADFINHDHPYVEWRDHVDDWLKKITDPRKRAVAISALDSVMRTGLHKTDKEALSADVFVKRDEGLLQIHEDHSQMKPRAIIRVHPKIQVVLGPVIMVLTERLHAEWPWTYLNDRVQDPRSSLTDEEVCAIRGPGPVTYRLNSYRHDDWLVRITFGSDATDKRLTEWAAEALHWLNEGPLRAWILVGGDDSLVLFRRHDRIELIEGDFSMFDQSQSLGPLTAQAGMMACLGMCPVDVDLLMQTYYATYNLRPKADEAPRWQVSHHHRPMRATGGPDTTLGNSAMAAMAWVVILEWGYLDMEEDLMNIPEGMAQLGFKLKLKQPRDLHEATFLKGGWVVTDRFDYCWTPLPSRVLKLGKALTPPGCLYPRLSYRGACAQFLNDVAAGYRNFAQGPGIRGFVTAFYRGPPVRDLFLTAPWKVASEYDSPPGQVVACPGWAFRYSVGETELWELDTVLAKAEPFTFLQHPLCRVLALVDYN